MGRFNGKVAMVTGAARGQGRAHALALASEGADVILVDILENLSTIDYGLGTDQDLAETVARVEALDRRALAVRADVRSQQAIDEAVAAGISEFGQIDILIANAGVWALEPFWTISEEQWAQMQDVVLAGAWRSAKAVAPHMIARRSGAIVMTSSVNGIEAGPGHAHYTAAKHGVLGLMKTVAIELAPYGVRCNAVCPGAMDTAMNDWQGAYDFMAGHAGGTAEDRRVGGRHWSALAGRSMLPAESVARAAAFLASDDASEITGVALPVDGGHLALPGFNTNPV